MADFFGKNNNKKNNMFPFKKNNLLLYVVIGIIVLTIWLFISQGLDINTQEISYSRFKQLVRDERVQSVEIKGLDITGKAIDSNGDSFQFKTIKPAIEDPNLITLLEEKGVQEIKGGHVDDGSSMWLIINIIFFVLIIGFFIWSSRRISRQSGGLFDVGKSKSKKINKELTNITFKDVAGLENVKRDVQEIIEFLKDPSKFISLGAQIPRGVLLVGPPGTGKTLIAKAVAGEANVPFYSATGSEFVEMFVGVGASRVRDLFTKARQDAPCIVFIDEIDAVGRSRGTGLGGGHDEREQTLNQLLTEMDGMDTDRSIIVMAATNRPDVLDQALLRPGRFDRRVTLDKPRLKERHAILNIHARNKPMAEDADLNIIARATPGFSGADLENVLNEAALLAGRAGKRKITMEFLNEAKDKVLMGDKRPGLLSKEEKKMTAYHEAGHALVSRLLPMTDPVYKITIIPRGMSMGSTWYLPEGEKFGFTKTQLESMVCSLLAGYLAEKIFIGDVSTGASNDIKKATQTVRNMITKYGMNDKIGLVNFGVGEEHIFLGKELGAEKKFSDLTLAEIDSEIKRVINDCKKITEELLIMNEDTMHKIAQFLYLNEEMTKDELEEIIKKYSKKSLEDLKERMQKYKSMSKIKILDKEDQDNNGKKEDQSKNKEDSEEVIEVESNELNNK